MKASAAFVKVQKDVVQAVIDVDTLDVVFTPAFQRFAILRTSAVGLYIGPLIPLYLGVVVMF